MGNISHRRSVLKRYPRAKCLRVEDGHYIVRTFANNSDMPLSARAQTGTTPVEAWRKISLTTRKWEIAVAEAAKAAKIEALAEYDGD